MDKILEAKNITKNYPGVIALADVNFNVYKGKVNVLVGENGAGKSTLMKILSGVEKQTSGDIFLDNQKLEIMLLYFQKYNKNQFINRRTIVNRSEKHKNLVLTRLFFSVFYPVC